MDINNQNIVFVKLIGDSILSSKGIATILSSCLSKIHTNFVVCLSSMHWISPSGDLLLKPSLVSFTSTMSPCHALFRNWSLIYISSSPSSLMAKQYPLLLHLNLASINDSSFVFSAPYIMFGEHHPNNAIFSAAWCTMQVMLRPLMLKIYILLLI